MKQYLYLVSVTQRKFKQLFMLLFDSIVLVAVLLGSFSIRLGYWYWPSNDLVLILAILAVPVIAIPIFIRFGLYRSIVRFIGFKALWSIAQAVSLYALVWGVVGFMAAAEGIPRSVILINWTLAILAIGGSRMIAQQLLSSMSIDSSILKHVIIYGAGEAGRQLSIALTQSSEYKPIAFVDDSHEMQGHTINGVAVYSPSSLKSLIKKHQVSEVLLAMPAMSRTRRHEIVNFLQSYPVLVRLIPSVTELAQGKVEISDLRQVSIKDLLGRDSVSPNKALLSRNISNKIVMVTGAGGSIGSELCRQIIQLKPNKLILFELNELALYDINTELLDRAQQNVEVLPILGSVTNADRIVYVCKHFGVQTIYHAAAYKHVPLVELNHTEGVNNNIFGTLNCAQAAIEHNVETFVLISTDKAVRPSSVMGATKRLSEMILQALSDKKGTTKFTMVRFGNVLGSSGSVIPLFKKQIKAGGPVTVTDADIIRYFMTVSEAVELVIQAGAMGLGGDVFVLDMGQPVRIVDLAKQMIRLSGLQVKDEDNPTGDIAIKYIGLRPGEKLYEELLIGDNTSKTDNPMIMRAQEHTLTWKELEVILSELKQAIGCFDQKKIRQLLIQAIPEFQPQSEITDSMYVK